MGLSFEVRVSRADETPPEGASPDEAAAVIARRKAQAVACAREDYVLGADTTVLTPEGAVFGKPHSADEAREMLTALSGRTHTVVTGLAVLHGEDCLVRTVRTRVRFRTIGEHEIEAYIATGEPFDKAGAYGIQGRAAWLVEALEGDYFNVVGLPLEPLGEMLGQMGFDVWKDGGRGNCADSGNPG